MLNLEVELSKLKTAYQNLVGLRAVGRDIGREVVGDVSHVLSLLRSSLVGLNFSDNKFIEGYSVALYDTLSSLHLTELLNRAVAAGLLAEKDVEATWNKVLGEFESLSEIEKRLVATLKDLGNKVVLAEQAAQALVKNEEKSVESLVQKVESEVTGAVAEVKLEVAKVAAETKNEVVKVADEVKSVVENVVKRGRPVKT